MEHVKERKSVLWTNGERGSEDSSYRRLSRAGLDVIHQRTRIGRQEWIRQRWSPEWEIIPARKEPQLDFCRRIFSVDHCISPGHSWGGPSNPGFVLISSVFVVEPNENSFLTRGEESRRMNTDSISVHGNGSTRCRVTVASELTRLWRKYLQKWP